MLLLLTALTTTQLIEISASVAATVVFVLVFAFRRASKVVSDIEKLIRNESQSTRSAVQAEIYGLNGLLQGCLDSLPYPAWIKLLKEDPQGSQRTMRMQFINRSYEEYFGVPRYAYVGREDKDVWGDDLGDSFFKNDMLVLAKMEPMIVMERIRLSDGSMVELPFQKFPLSDGKYTGVIGFLIPDENMPKFMEDELKGHTIVETPLKTVNGR